jgi:hypothetical protein
MPVHDVEVQPAGTCSGGFRSGRPGEFAWSPASNEGARKGKGMASAGGAAYQVSSIARAKLVGERPVGIRMDCSRRSGASIDEDVA